MVQIEAKRPMITVLNLVLDVLMGIVTQFPFSILILLLKFELFSTNLHRKTAFVKIVYFDANFHFHIVTSAGLSHH